MLVTILIWGYTLLTAGLLGWAGCQLLSRVLHFQGQGDIPFSVQWLLGFAALTCLASFLSLALPLGLAAQLGVLGLALLALLVGRKNLAPLNIRHFFQVLRSRAPVYFLLALGVLSLLFLATSTPTNDDTGLYHAQAIRWIETFPAVPGLANIHTRLGYGSSWLLSQALFSFAFLGLRSFHLNSSVLFLLAILYFAGGLGKIWSGRSRFSDWARSLCFPLVFYILTSEVSSPGTDAPVTLITWILLSEWLVFWEEGGPENSLRPFLLTLLSVYAVTIKLSAFPLLLPGLGWLGRGLLQRRWKTALLVSGLSLLILLPWAARNVVATGYPVYPVAALDVFSVDWKVPPNMVRDEALGIQAWARLPRQDPAHVLSLPLVQWVKEWFANLTLNRRAILLAVVLAPLGYGLLAFWKKFRAFLKVLLRRAWPVYLTTYLGLAFWFIGAPDYRFGTGFIIFGVVLALAPALAFVHQSWPAALKALPWITAGVLILFQGSILVSSINIKTLPQRLVLPADYPYLPSAPCTAVEKTFMIPEEVSYGLCWYAVFPCIPSCRNDFAMRGPDLQDGFRHKAPAP